MTKTVHQHTVKKSLQQSLLYAMLCLFALSCTTEETLKNIPITESKETVMRMTINTPPTTIPEIKSKSQTAEECEINEIRVLVFKNGQYAYAADGDISAQADYSTTFTTTLLSSSSPVTLFLIANANESIANAGIEIGNTPSQVKRKIQRAYTSGGIGAPFPMYGEYTMPSVSDAQSTLSGIKMLRSIARADVIVDEAVSNFRMVSVQLYRVNNHIQIAPNDMVNTTVTSPSVPGEASGNVITTQFPVSGNASQAQLYVPESAAPDESEQVTKATCIIVGGQYENGPVTYYRIDFNLGISGHPFGQILRNHQYNFNIVKVGMPGESTPEAAANKSSTGIIAEVQTWDENSTDMYFDSEHYIGVSARTATLKSWSGSTCQISVNTDISNYTIQWCDANGNPLGDPASQTSIQSTNFNVNVKNNGTLIHIESLNTNRDFDDMSEYFVIRARQWNIVIQIKQTGYAVNQDEIIRVLSFTNVGDLGNGYYSDGADASALPMRQILNYYFGPAGMVDFGGFSFKEVAQSTMSGSNVLSTNIMADYDVIFYTYDSKPSQGTINNTIRWLNTKANRVLIVAADWTGTNIDLLSALDDTWDWTYKNDGGVFNFVAPTDDNRVFTQTGPFGSVSSSSIFGRTDALWGRTSNYSADVIPLLTSSYDGGMVLGVNKKKRIVYVGDCNIFTNTGTNYLSGSGALNKDQDYLLANLWAWITNVVLSGR